MTALVRSGTYVVEAHASWGAWAARCGLCPNGTPFRHLPGYLRPGTPQWECWLCGTVTEVIWPSEAMMAGVERLLMMRPDPTTRNWFPPETLHDLMFENGAHGIFDNLEERGIISAPGDSLFAVDDLGIRKDNLPALKPRTRQEISA